MQRSMIPRVQLVNAPPGYVAKPSPTDPRLRSASTGGEWVLGLERNPSGGPGNLARYEPPIRYNNSEGRRGSDGGRGRGAPCGNPIRPQRYFHTDRVTGDAAACCDPNPYGGGNAPYGADVQVMNGVPRQRIARGNAAGTNPRFQRRSDSFLPQGEGKKERDPPRRPRFRASEIHEPCYNRGSPGGRGRGRGGRGGGPRTPPRVMFPRNWKIAEVKDNLEGEQRKTLTARRGNLNPSPATPADVAIRSRLGTATVVDTLTPFQGLNSKAANQRGVSGTSETWVTTTADSSEERKARKRSASNAGLAERSSADPRSPLGGANTEVLGKRPRKLETYFEEVKENETPLGKVVRDQDPEETKN